MSFLAEVFEWDYEFFVGELTSPTRDYTEFQTALLYLVASITNPRTSLKAITTALERVDGRQPDQLEVVYPKFYTVYPRATSVEGVPRAGGEGYEIMEVDTPKRPVPSDDVKGLRAEIQRLSEQKSGYTDQVLLAAQLLADGKPSINHPKVKTVAAAMLYRLSRRSLLALDTLLEQVEGKVKHKLELVGSDVYLTSFAEVAPAGAQKNKDGVYQIENTQVTNMWTERLDAGRRVRG